MQLQDMALLMHLIKLGINNNLAPKIIEAQQSKQRPTALYQHLYGFSPTWLGFWRWYGNQLPLAVTFLEGDGVHLSNTLHSRDKAPLDTKNKYQRETTPQQPLKPTTQLWTEKPRKSTTKPSTIQSYPHSSYNCSYLQFHFHMTAGSLEFLHKIMICTFVSLLFSFLRKRCDRWDFGVGYFIWICRYAVLVCSLF